VLNRIIRWTPEWPDDVIVWIDVAKLDAAWRLERDFYVGADGYGPRSTSLGKYLRFGRWLRGRRDDLVKMPHVSVWKRMVSFTNGRHRFAWCRDHGVRALPVTTSPGEQALQLRAKFGTALRPSRMMWRARGHRY